jgi:hypothetical protein
MNSLICPCLLAAGLIAGLDVAAADAVYSGPQPGERTTAFKVLELTGPADGKERDPVAEDAGQPTALVFVHAMERSLVPLLRTVDQYGALRKDKLKTEVVFLAKDRIEGEQRARAAARSLQLQSRTGLSLDGAEGPGNYGLNKECLMTILTTKDNKVLANFALVQPGIADAPKVIEALARACGDTAPPTIDQLSARQPGRDGAMRRDGAKMERVAKPADGTPAPAKPKEEFPGAVPTDAKLNSLLREAIRPTNDDATVNKLLAEIATHVQGNKDLTQQAIDGWKRVLHFGDHYGTAHLRKTAREQMERLQQAPSAKPKPQ